MFTEKTRTVMSEATDVAALVTLAVVTVIATKGLTSLAKDWKNYVVEKHTARNK